MLRHFPLRNPPHFWLNLRRSPLPLFLLVLLWSALLGLGLARAVDLPAIGTVDPIAPVYATGHKVYLDTCSGVGCHVALPPAVLPTETWKILLQDPLHYGRELQPLSDPSLTLVWEYLRAYSRPQIPNEETPYRLNESRYFRALHPQVELPNPISVNTCITCHPGAAKFNFRTLLAQ